MSTPVERGDARPPSFARNLAKSLATALVGGLVVPALIFYSFDMPLDDEGARWVLWGGIALALLCIGVAFAHAAIETRSERRTWRLKHVGRPGTAQVLGVEQARNFTEAPPYKIHVRVTGEDLTPFEARRKMVVSVLELQVLASGSAAVLVDPETGDWEFDWDSTPSGSVQTIAQGNAGQAVAPVQGRSPTERLAELDDLLERDLIRPEEYDEARRRIIDGG